MSSTTASNKQLLSQLNSCLKQLTATCSVGGQEDVALHMKTRTVVLALMEACPASFPLSTVLSVTEFLQRKFPWLLESGYQGLFLAGLLKIMLTGHRDALQSLPALVNLAMGLMPACGAQQPVILQQLHLGCCDLLLDAEHRLLTICMASANRPAGPQAAEQPPNATIPSDSDLRAQAFVGVTEWHNGLIPQAAQPDQGALDPDGAAAGQSAASTKPAALTVLWAQLQDHASTCRSAQVAAQLLTSLLLESPMQLGLATPGVIVHTLMQLAAHGDAPLQTCCWGALGTLVTVTQHPHVPVEEILGLLTWTMQAWQQQLVVIPPSDLSAWAGHLCLAVRACVDALGAMGTLQQHAQHLAGCLMVAARCSVDMATRSASADTSKPNPEINLSGAPVARGSTGGSGSGSGAGPGKARGAASSGAASCAGSGTELSQQQEVAAQLEAAGQLLGCVHWLLQAAPGAGVAAEAVVCGLMGLLPGLAGLDTQAEAALLGVQQAALRVLEHVTAWLDDPHVAGCIAASVASIPALQPLVLTMHGATTVPAPSGQGLSTGGTGGAATATGGGGAGSKVRPAGAMSAGEEEDEVMIVGERDSGGDMAGPARKRRKSSKLKQTQIQYTQAPEAMQGVHGATDAQPKPQETGQGLAVGQGQPAGPPSSTVQQGACGAVAAAAHLFGQQATSPLNPQQQRSLAQLHMQQVLHPDTATAATGLVQSILCLCSADARPGAVSGRGHAETGPVQQACVHSLMQVVCVLGPTCSVELLGLLVYAAISWLVRASTSTGSGSGELEATQQLLHLAAAMLWVVQARLHCSSGKAVAPELLSLLNLLLDACVLAAEQARCCTSSLPTAAMPAVPDAGGCLAACGALVAASASLTFNHLATNHPESSVPIASPQRQPGNAFAVHAHRLAVQLLAVASQPPAVAAEEQPAASQPPSITAARATATLLCQAVLQLSAMQLSMMQNVTSSAGATVSCDPGDQATPMFAQLAKGWSTHLKLGPGGPVELACVRGLRAIVQACSAGNASGLLPACCSVLASHACHLPHAHGLQLHAPPPAPLSMRRHAHLSGMPSGHGDLTQPTQALSDPQGGGSCSNQWWPHATEMEALLMPILLEHSAAAEALRVVQMFLLEAPKGMLKDSRKFLESLHKLLASGSPAVREGMVSLVRCFLRPEVLSEAFGTHAHEEPVITCEIRFLETLKRLLNEKDLAISGRVAVLQAAAGLDGLVHIPDGHEASPLLMVVGCLGRPEPQLRSAAAELLEAICERRGRDVQWVLLKSEGSRGVLEHVGKNIVKEPRLLGDLSQWIGIDEMELAERVVPCVIGHLCMHECTPELTRLAALIGTTVQNMFVRNARFALAQAFVESTQEPNLFATFIYFTDKLMQKQGNNIIEVIQYTAKDTAEQMVWMAGLPDRWDGYTVPKAVHDKTVENLVHIIELLHSKGMSKAPKPELQAAELLAGHKVATFLKEFGSTFSSSNSLAHVPPVPAASALAVCVRGNSAGNSVGTVAAASRQSSGSAPPAAPTVSQPSCGPDQEPRQLQSLRALAIMLLVLNSNVADHVFHVAAVLTAALRVQSSRAVALQALNTWRVWLNCLANEAPLFLTRLVAQTAVVLIPFLDTDKEDVQAVAVGIMDDLVTKIPSGTTQEKAVFRTIPTLPSHAALAKVNQIIQLAVNPNNTSETKSRGNQVKMLIGSLKHESLVVRHTALNELRAYITKNRSWIHQMIENALGLSTSSTPAPSSIGTERAAADKQAATAAHYKLLTDLNRQGSRCKGGERGNVDGFNLLTELFRALLQCTHHVTRTSLARSIRERCAECLGLLGPIDPARINVEPTPPDGLIEPGGDGLPLAQAIVTRHLLRLLTTADDIQAIEFTSYTLQAILQHYTPTTGQAPTAAATKPPRPSGKATDERGLFYRLLEDQQSILKPFLTSKWTVHSTNQAPGAAAGAAGGAAAASNGGAGAGTAAPVMQVIFSTRNHSYRRWLELWLRTMIKHTKGPCQPMLAALDGVLKFDVPLMMFVLPHVVHNIITQGTPEEAACIRNEIITVLAVASQQTPGSADSSANQKGRVSTFSLGSGGAGSKRPRVTPAPQAPATEPVAELEYYLQAIFTLFDILSRWLRDANIAAAAQQAAASSSRGSKGATGARSGGAVAGGGTSGAPGDAGGGAVGKVPYESTPAGLVTKFIDSIPREDMAKAALRCGSHARALLYYESWVREQQGGGLNPPSLKSDVKYDASQVTFLLEVYGQLEEPDGIAGLIQLRKGGPIPKDAIMAAEKAGQWAEAQSMYEQMLSKEQKQQEHLQQQQQQQLQQQGSSARVVDVSVGISSSAEVRDLQQGALRGLLQLGHLQALLQQVDGLLTRLPRDEQHAAARTQVAAAGVAAAWRLGRWSLLQEYLEVARQELDGASMLSGGSGSSAAGGGWAQAESVGRASLLLGPQDEWELCVGGLLMEMQAGQFAAVEVGIAASRRDLMALLPALSQESYSRAYPTLAKLGMLQELQDAASLRQRIGPGAVSEDYKKRLKWAERSAAAQASLSLQESHLSLRRQVAGLLGWRLEAGECRLQYAKLCRSNGHLEAAEAAVLEAVEAKAPGAYLERAKLMWHSGRERRALAELQHELSKRMLHARSGNESMSYRLQTTQIALQLAKWNAEQGQEASTELRKKFEEAISLEPKWEKPYFQYARYLDHLYQDAKRRQKGKGTGTKTDRLGGRAKIKDFEADLLYHDLLPDVLANYGRCIQAGYHHVLQCLPRMLTLYCDFGTECPSRPQHNEKLAATKVVNLMKEFMREIPPVAWLVTLSQIISRICHRNPDVRDVLQGVLERCLAAFPQHTLWALACLMRSSSSSRRQIAADLLGKAKDNQPQLVSGFKDLAKGLIALTMWQPPRDKVTKALSARAEFNSFISTLPKCKVMVPVQEAFAVALPPVPLGSSAAAAANKAAPASTDGLVTITGMQDEITVMNSLQRPKKITLIGSDGKDYPFLAKPKDDLRKDYRLMDFVTVANRLFAANSASRRRGLRLRTYAVIVLAEDCGILQWLNNLTPFKGACEDIYASTGTVKKNEYTNIVRKIWEGWSPETTNNNRAKLMDKVLERFPPKLHQWWLTRFPEPAAWLRARLTFTRTNASWCMTGHILGLGDRHGENIMIDTNSGETVQVDFGCLFDRGLTLEVPEMVPFRLTQNVVDSFGVSGVEGAFRKSAENTLEVLRRHRGTLMTCAETFLYDPLVDWARKKGEAPTQATEGDQDNPQAKDALATLEGRLTGTCIGVSSIPSLPLSVEGQAARLMDEAMDKNNLGRMYIWWMPWF